MERRRHAWHWLKLPIFLKFTTHIGVFHFASGATYEGAWEDNFYEGRGKFTFSNGSFYEGEFHNNMMHGQGCFTDTKGEQWKGQFYNNNGPGLTRWFN